MNLDRIQIALIVIAALLFLESTVGILGPAWIKRTSETLVKSRDKLSPFIGVILLVVAVFLWALILAGLTLDRWVLLFISVVIAAMGHSWLRPGSFQHTLRVLFVDRSVVFIRLFYIAELTVGGLILWVALFRTAAQ